MTYAPTTDYAPGLKSIKGTLNKRNDVNADFRTMGRPVTKEFPLQYAFDETQIPRSVVDLYATG